MKKEFFVHIFDITKKDFQEAKGNKILLIILLGMVVLPSLYAWFNIQASWDPYGNTQYLKVAVVNQDKGSDFKHQHYDIGNKVVENLKENRLLDWQFVDEERAEQGLVSGEYYATILLPEDFSKNLLSITEPEVEKAIIKYSVNEKTNAIAPKITDKGADAIQDKIGKTLIETISETTLTALGGVSTAGGDLDEHLNSMKETLKTLDAQIDNAQTIIDASNETLSTLDGSINNAKSTLPEMKATMKDIQGINSDIQEVLTNTNTAFKDLNPTIKKELDFALLMQNQATEGLEQLARNSDTDTATALEDVRTLQDKVQYAMQNTQKVIEVLNYINVLDRPILKEAVKDLTDYYKLLNTYNGKLTTLSMKLQTNNQDRQNSIKELLEIGQELEDKARFIQDNYDEGIAQPINDLATSGLNISADVTSLLNDANTLYPNLEGLLQNTSGISSNLKNSGVVTSSSLMLLKSQVRSSIATIDKMQSSKEFKDFNTVIQSNIMERVDFLKSPVEVEEHRIYPMVNYGSAMTPFYSVLAAWVGVLILCAVLSTKVHGPYSSREEYFGRMILFIILALAQSLVISLGNFFIVGVTAAHPVGFTLLLMFCSLVFTTIIYSLVSVFDNVGKAIAIFLLVIQIGGSGGTFPVQMAPPFFRAINKIIPFTYGIEACREAIGGIYWPNLWGDLLALVIFLMIGPVLCTIFKAPINRLGHPFKGKLNSSHLIGH